MSPAGGEAPASEARRYEEHLMRAGLSERQAKTLVAECRPVLESRRRRIAYLEAERRRPAEDAEERARLLDTPPFDSREHVKSLLRVDFSKSQAQALAAGYYGMRIGSWKDIDSDLERIRRETEDLEETGGETGPAGKPAAQPEAEASAEDHPQG